MRCMRVCVEFERSVVQSCGKVTAGATADKFATIHSVTAFARRQDNVVSFLLVPTTQCLTNHHTSCTLFSRRAFPSPAWLSFRLHVTAHPFNFRPLSSRTIPRLPPWRRLGLTRLISSVMESPTSRFCSRLRLWRRLCHRDADSCPTIAL